MKKFSCLLIISLLIIMYSACKKEPGGNIDIPPSGEYSMVNVQVKLPAGSAVNISKTKLNSFSTDFAVGTDGKAQVGHNQGANEIVHLFDESGKLLLAGFVSDANREISARSTAQVMLYHGLEMTYQPDSVKTYFTDVLVKLPELNDYYTEIEQAFASDPQMIEKKTYQPALKKMIAKILVDSKEINIRPRQSHVVTEEIKSMMYVKSLDEMNVALVNSGKRPGYAFLYQTAYKDKNGLDHTLMQTISGDKVAKQSFDVAAVTSIKEIFGKGWAITMGNGYGFNEKESAPIKLSLLEGVEKEATYKIRVIGPGAKTTQPLTNTEQKKLDEMYYEFFAVDMLLPIMLDAISQKSALNMNGGKLTTAQLQPYISKVKAMLLASPGVLNDLYNTNYRTALQGFIGTTGSLSAEWGSLLGTLVNVLDGAYQNDAAYHVQSIDEVNAAYAKFDRPLAWIKDIQQPNNFTSVYHAARSSQSLEEWEVKVKDNDVKLTPRSGDVATFETLPLTVKTNVELSSGQSIVYKWTTTGKYGKIKSGTVEAIELNVDAANITYRSTAATANLGAQNLERIYVTAYIKQGAQLTAIGSDTAIINVKANKLEMRPNNVILSLKNGSSSSVRLYLEKTNGSNDIVSNSALDYKVEWSTAGVYGKFNGKETNITTSTNAVNYTALDDEAKNATENITAKVYFKAKTETKWYLRETVTGRVKIDNDDKKIVLDLKLELLHGDTVRHSTSGDSYSCWVVSAVTFPANKDAKSYTLNFYGFKSPVIGAPTTHTWLAGAPSPNAAPDFVRPGYDGTNYTVIYAYSYNLTFVPDHIDHSGPIDGRAQVVITLK